MKYLVIFSLLCTATIVAKAQDTKLHVLVFSKTAKFRHKSIPKGVETFASLAIKYNWSVDYSEDSGKFDSTLFAYDVLVFLNTTGDILNDKQQMVMQEFFARGKGFVGIHAASDTEHEWPWYIEMVGAEFESHPKIQNASLTMSDNYTPFFGKEAKARKTTDEWYNFKKPVCAHANVLSSVDESSYEGGKMNGNHPITWFHHYEGGRVFFTGLGHTNEQFDDEKFLDELSKGVMWAGSQINDPKPSSKVPSNLLTSNLNDNWDVFIGVPHGTIKDLPGVDPSSNGKIGEPLGLNNDPKQVFKIEMMGKEPVLHISGEIFGALTSKLEYENYHFKAQFKWGEKIWEPRLDKPKDNGILYHGVNASRTFWNVWRQAQEFQVQIHDMGDYYALGGVKASIALDHLNGSKELYYNKKGPKTEIMSNVKAPNNMAKRGFDNEKKEGEWNTLELYCVGDKSVHVVNGKVVMFLEDLQQKTKNGKWIPSTKGLIQIQSEAAEAYYKNIQIQSISSFPKSILKQIK